MPPAALAAKEFHPHIEDIFLYCDSVLSGEKPACQWEIKAVERFYADLDRDWRYTFDHNKAIRICAFVEKLPHVKSKWAARRERIVLQPWQKFLLGQLFGWVDKTTGLRRFRRTYVKAPRKNGKSVIGAGIALYMLVADGEFGAEIYCGAMNEKQAWEVFRPAMIMIEKTPALRRTFDITVRARSIEAANNSRFEPLIGKPGDGSSPSLSIHDEFHQHPNSDQLDTMATGMGAREQPLQLVITTAGVNIDGPCFELERYAERILTGIDAGGVNDDEFFALIYGIDADDDWTTEAALIKANPNFGISVDAEFLRSEQKRAIQDTAKQNAFKTKHLNVWCWAKSAFFNSQKWLNLADKSLNIDDFKGDKCFPALDLAKIKDLTCRIATFRRDINGDANYFVFSKFWLPLETIQNEDNPELQERYQRWYLDGYLHDGGEAEMDLDLVVDDVVALHQEGYSIAEVPHDPHLGFLVAKGLSEAGLTPVEMRQHGSVLGPGMRELEAAIAAGRVHHDGNPVMSWCIGNVLGKEYPNGGLMPAKETAINKIDGAVGLIMGIARAMLGESEESVYSSRGVISF